MAANVKPNTAVDIPTTLANMFTNDAALRRIAVRCQIVDAHEHLDELLKAVEVEFHDAVERSPYNLSATNLENRIKTGISYGDKLLVAISPYHVCTTDTAEKVEHLKQHINRLRTFYEDTMKPVMDQQRRMRDDSGISSGPEDAADDSDAIFSDSDVDSRKHDDPANKVRGVRVLSDDE